MDVDDMSEMWEEEDEEYVLWDPPELLEHCIGPVLQQILQRLLPVICVTFFVGELLQRGFTGRWANMICIVSGLLILRSFVDEREAMVFAIFNALAYFWIYVATNYRGGVSYVTFVSISVLYLIIREHFPIFGDAQWIEIRGISMIALMKTISFAFELTTYQRQNVPTPDEYFAYILYPGSLSFGPWVSFLEHCRVTNHTGWTKNYCQWSLAVLWKLSTAVTYVLMSSCVFHFLSEMMRIRSPYAGLFFDAMMIRFSHYFICRLGEGMFLLCGPRAVDAALPNPIVSISHIEFPRSLVDVVVHWNIPMHSWLKQHVFNPLRARSIDKSVAAILTFVFSAMLHGLNIHLTAILISIAIFSFIEYTFREVLATLLNSCVRARSCVGCNHRYHSTRLLVQLTNFGFYLLTLSNLAYLGALLDDVENSRKSGAFNIDYFSNHFQRWRDVQYLNHRMMFAISVFTCVIWSILRISTRA